MSRATRAAVVVTVLALSGCASMKWYTMPVGPAEGMVLVPALISTSESMGLRSYGGPNGAVTELEDGTRLSWQESADHRSFILLIDLPSSVQEPDRPAKWHEAKVRADEIWALAADARQRSGVGAAVIIAPPAQAPASPGASLHVSVPGMSVQVNSGAPSAPAAGSTCRSGTDCGPGEFCRNRGDGVSLCMGNGGAGSYCVFGTDCGSGLFCRPNGALKTCQ